MPEWKWIDRSQPQTLQSAVLFCYVFAVIGVLGQLLWGAPPFLLLTVLMVVPAYFIANGKQWGYYACIALAFLLLIGQGSLLYFYPVIFISMLFTVALIALLLHPQSREYVRVWFPKPKRQPPRRW